MTAVEPHKLCDWPAAMAPPRLDADRADRIGAALARLEGMNFDMERRP